MKFIKKKRIYESGMNKKIYIKDVGRIYLNNNEQVTFVTKNNAKHDVVRKDWGFYATQSINSRLKKNFRTALVVNKVKRVYIMLVEKRFISKFNKYCKQEDQKVLAWLDKL